MSNEESNPNEVENKSESTIGSVSVKPPIFDESCCNGWSRIVEAQFLLAKVSLPPTKFYITISALPAKVVSKLSNNLWDSQDYGKLKRVVIGFFEQSKSEYVSAVEYVRGSDNVVADHLSRSVNQITIDVFDLTAIAKLQDSDQKTKTKTRPIKILPTQ